MRSYIRRLTLRRPACRPNGFTLSSRRHEVLRGTADTRFSKSAKRRSRRATTAAACLLLRSVSRRRAGTDEMHDKLTNEFEDGGR